MNIIDHIDQQLEELYGPVCVLCARDDVRQKLIYGLCPTHSRELVAHNELYEMQNFFEGRKNAY